MPSFRANWILYLENLADWKNEVTKLETDNVEVKKEVKEVASPPKKQKPQPKIFPSPKMRREKVLFKQIRIDLKSEEVKAKGPWSNPNTRISMKRNLTEHNVKKLLGNPDDIKLSLNPRVDRIYIYSGDIDADGTMRKQGKFLPRSSRIFCFTI